MKVTEAGFTRRYKVGEYEHEEYTLKAIVEDEDGAGKVLSELKNEVHSAFASEIAAPTGKKRKPQKQENEDADDDGDSSDVDEETDDVEDLEDGDGEGSEDDEGDDSDDSDDSDADAEEDDSDEDEGKKSKKTRSTNGSKKSTNASTKKSGKGFKKKPQVYQRTNENHKEIFSNVLKAVAPNWKKDAKSKAKGKAASQKMEGKDFLDENGVVLKEFKAAVKKLMGK